MVTVAGSRRRARALLRVLDDSPLWYLPRQPELAKCATILAFSVLAPPVPHYRRGLEPVLYRCVPGRAARCCQWASSRRFDRTELGPLITTARAIPRDDARRGDDVLP